ncbi:MAG: hypothetical protein AAF683_09455 [Pseudomonadota bacterium]
MSFLVALAAFAAIISVYSTVVTIIVEGLHKVLGLRSSGLNEMLRAFYDETLTKLQPDGTLDHEKAVRREKGRGPSEGAKRFADRISLTESSRSPKFWYASRWPLVGRFFTERRQTLTTREFIESLAETPEGAALRRYPRADLRQAINISAYQFERLGDRYRSYFRSRANMLAVVVGIAVAVFANFDAIAVYRALSTNAELSSRVTLAIDHEQLELMRLRAQNVQGSTVTETNVDAAFNDAAEWTALAGNVRSLGVPIGRKMFPHCEGYEFTDAANAISGTSGTRGEGLQNNQYYDARCGKERQQPVNLIWKQNFDTFRKRPGATNGPVILDWFRYRWARIAAIGNNLETFMFWVLGIVVAGGLLGLGAPFWFKVFTRLSAVANPAARATLTASNSSGTTTSQAAQSVPSELSVRDGVSENNTTVIDELERGYVTVLTSQSDGISSPLEAASKLGSIEDARPGRQVGVRPRNLDQGRGSSG